MAGGGPAAPALLVLVPLGCLSASAGLATAVAVLAGAAGKGRTVKAALLVGAGNAPWIAAGLLHASSATSDPAAAEVFALRGEGSVPAPLAALTLGGIWNTAVQSGARTGALGWVALVALVGLAAVGAGAWWRLTPPRERTTLLVCWVVGWVLAVLTWLAPGAVGWASEHVAGAGIVRDGARSLVLCAPLLAVLVAEGVRVLAARAPRERVARAALAVGAVLLPVALLPGLALGVGHRVEPADYPAAYDDARRLLDGRDGDVLVLPLSSYRAPAWNHEHLVLDPIGRYLGHDYVASDVLVIDGVPLSGRTRGSATRPSRWPSQAQKSGRRHWPGSGSAPWSPTPPHRVTCLPRSPGTRSSTIRTCGSPFSVRSTSGTSRPPGGWRWRPPGSASWRRGHWPSSPPSGDSEPAGKPASSIRDTPSGRLCPGLREGPASEDFDHVCRHGRGWGSRSRLDVRPARLADGRAR